jgi:hypothetical protein
MSLPIAGGKKTPTRSSTHRAIEFGRLANLGMEVEEIAGDEPLPIEKLLDLSAEQGKDASHYLAAATLSTEVVMENSRPVSLVFCAGTCQQWGALECMDHAFTDWEKRRDRKQPLFDITARKCLDRCADAAVVEVRSPSGTVVVTSATPAKIDEALAAVLE